MKLFELKTVTIKKNFKVEERREKSAFKGN